MKFWFEIMLHILHVILFPLNGPSTQHEKMVVEEATDEVYASWINFAMLIWSLEIAHDLICQQPYINFRLQFVGWKMSTHVSLFFAAVALLTRYARMPINIIIIGAIELVNSMLFLFCIKNLNIIISF